MEADMPDSPHAMTHEIQLSIRIPPDVPDRADELAARLADLPEYRAHRMSRATVLRMAMLRGLDALEREHPAEGKRGAKR